MQATRHMDKAEVVVVVAMAVAVAVVVEPCINHADCSNHAGHKHNGASSCLLAKAAFSQ